MYYIILFVFFFISLVLICLITFNSDNYNNIYYSSQLNRQFNILNFIYNDSVVNTIIKIFIGLFFIISIVMCIINVRQSNK